MKKLAFALAVWLLLLPVAASAVEESVFPLKKKDSGDTVVMVQKRLQDLGYVHFRPTGKYGDMTYDGVRRFQQRNKLTVNGQVDKRTFDAIFSPSPVKTAVNDKITRTVGPILRGMPETYGKATPWNEVAELFPVGAEAVIMDFNSAKAFRVRRVGGNNHATVQCLTVEDAAAYKACFGGEYTWEKRAALVEIGGVRHAASMFGMPNADASQTESGMEGSITVYFSGSTSDFCALPDEEHNSLIQLATES